MLSVLFIILNNYHSVQRQKIIIVSILFGLFVILVLKFVPKLTVLMRMVFLPNNIFLSFKPNTYH